jgi:glycosyltransferase involved in cell wall biosynthesis
VILAIDGVIREVVVSAKAGVFTPPGDPQALAQTVLHLKSRPSQAARMGLNGKEYVNKHFNRAVLAKILNEVLEITLQVHRRRIQG